MQENRISTKEGTVGIPDLIMVKGTRALVLDVTIRFKASESSLVETIKSLHPQGEVEGFPVGARGQWHKRNDMVLEQMGDSKSQIKRFSKQEIHAVNY